MRRSGPGTTRWSPKSPGSHDYDSSDSDDSFCNCAMRYRRYCIRRHAGEDTSPTRRGPLRVRNSDPDVEMREPPAPATATATSPTGTRRRVSLHVSGAGRTTPSPRTSPTSRTSPRSLARNSATATDGGLAPRFPTGVPSRRPVPTAGAAGRGGRRITWAAGVHGGEESISTRTRSNRSRPRPRPVSAGHSDDGAEPNYYYWPGGI